MIRSPRKEKLEVEKLSLEIKELKKFWLLKPTNFFPFLTFILALGSIIWTFNSKILDVRYQELSLEKKTLAFEIKQFEVKKDSLSREYKKLLDSLIYLKKHLLSKEYELTILSKNQSKLVSDKQKMKQLVEYYQKRITLIINSSKPIKQKKDTEKTPFVIPTAFTPNEDNLNDVFKVVFVKKESIRYFNLSIYDTWGSLIYNTDNYLDGWNGLLNGKVAESGNYYCKIEFESSSNNFSRVTYGQVFVLISDLPTANSKHKKCPAID